MKHLLPHFIQDQYRQGERKGMLYGCTLFADLSGFTALTERLMRRGPVGAEELSVALNHIFQPLVAIVYDNGGFIPYFAGDSFTAIFPCSHAEKKCHVAEQVLHTAGAILNRFKGEKSRDAVLSKHKIGIKIGLSFGQVFWGITGTDTHAFYFTGPAIDGSAQAQASAKSLEVVSDAHFLEKIGPWPNLRLSEVPEKPYFLLENLEEVTQKEPESYYDEPLPEPDESILSKFLPDELLEGDALGEFRNVVSIFISFKGVELHKQLDDFATVIANQCKAFAGYFKEVDFGDKGGVMVCFFGAPVVFENNIERALEFVSTITDIFQQKEGLETAKWRIGMTSGIAFTGIIGGHERCQYAAVGARVNLAARLMAYADWGEVMTDENVQRNRNFRFAPKGDLNYKGFEEPITTYRLTGHNLGGSTYGGAYIGRQQELNALIGFSDLLKEGRFAGLAYIFGEAGIGKSRISWEFRRALNERMTVSWYNCRSDQILRKPFNPFSFFLKNYFDQSPDNTPDENRTEFETNFLDLLTELEQSGRPKAEGLQKELRRIKSILMALVGLYETGSLYEQLDARGRYQNALSAMSTLFIAESTLQPIVIELEDAHWYDDMSREFLSNFLRTASKAPILFIANSRYEDDGTKKYVYSHEQLKEVDAPFLELDLNFLRPEDLKLFAEVRLGGKISAELQKLLQRMTQGNPFYAEQMTEYFIEMDLLVEENGLLFLKKQDIKLSDSVKEIMMARIDRLSGLVKDTVKAAAVIGREFELPVLSEVMQRQEEFIRRNGDLPLVLKEQIQSAERGQIWQAMNELRYIFRHSLLREAAYDMQLHTRLRELHEDIAEAIEKLYPKVKERYADLAFHYEQAENKKKTRNYLEKAAKHAQTNFQNRQAVSYYAKLIEYLEKKKGKNRKLVRMLLRKGSVLELTGQWEQADTTYRKALKRANELKEDFYQGRSLRRLGHLKLLQGNYSEASDLLEEAVNYFSKSEHRQSLAKTYGNLGTLYFRQGAYDKAKQWFRKAIRINEDLKLVVANGAIVGNLGLVYMNQGNYDEGIAALQKQIAQSERKNDPQGLTILYTNLGIIFLEKGSFDEAQTCLERGLKLSEELGNKLYMTICIGSLGTVWERKGDFEKASSLYQRDLDLTTQLGDKQGLAIASQLMAELLILKGSFDEALSFLETSLSLSQELGYKKGIAKALNSFGDTYFWKEDLEKSISYYTRALDISVEMGNKLVEGSSLIERGLAHLIKGQIAAAQMDLDKGWSVVQGLNNKELLHLSNILKARIDLAEGNKMSAQQILQQLLALSDSDRQIADAHFFLVFASENPEKHRLRARELYTILFEQTPEYIFSRRIKILEKMRG